LEKSVNQRLDAIQQQLSFIRDILLQLVEIRVKPQSQPPEEGKAEGAYKAT
jgi:hypothetical protein